MYAMLSGMADDPAVQTFTATAGAYDATRRQLIPCFDRFYGTAIEALGLVEGGPVRRVLDLGAGTGLLSGLVREALPDAELVLLDGSEAMLDGARDRLGDQGVTYVRDDLREPLPEGPFDAVVSSLAIHHLDDAGKRDVYARALAALRPGGAFVHAEQVLGETERVEARTWALWLARARGLGIDEEALAASVDRQALDRHGPLEPQLAWLRELGFADVHAPFRDGRFAVMVGLAPVPS